jgi:hypothetical protein
MGPEVVGLLIIPHISALEERLDESEEGKECNELLKSCCELHFNDGGKKKELLKFYGKYKKEFT